MKSHNWFFERRFFLKFIRGDRSERPGGGGDLKRSWDIFCEKSGGKQGKASGFARTWAPPPPTGLTRPRLAKLDTHQKEMEHFSPSRYIRSLTHPHKQTIKVNHFLLDIQIKSKHPSGWGRRIIGVWCAFDSFITGIWNADQAGGGGGKLLFTLQPLPTILSHKSFFSFSRPVRSPRVSAGLLILAPFTLGRARWAPDFWHYPCTLSCGIDLALLLLGTYCLMVSRAVIGWGLWGPDGAGLT